MQLCHGYDEDKFPFVIATDFVGTQVFLVNVNTQQRVLLINLKDCINSRLGDIKQTSKFAATQDASKVENYTNL